MCTLIESKDLTFTFLFSKKKKNHSLSQSRHFFFSWISIFNEQICQKSVPILRQQINSIALETLQIKCLGTVYQRQTLGTLECYGCTGQSLKQTYLQLLAVSQLLFSYWIWLRSSPVVMEGLQILFMI